MRGRSFVVMIMAVLAVSLGSTAALAQDESPYPPPPTASCTSSVVEPGDELTCTAPGFDPGTGVTVEVLGTGFERTFGTVADENGVATITFTVPEDALPGPATVTLTGVAAAGGTRTATTTFTVVAAAGETTGDGDTGGLVTTGAPVSNGVLVALGVIVAGGALVFAGRRRQRDVEVGS